jgi:two-component system, cell cycle response regulator
VSAEEISVLLVEDNPGDARLFWEALQEAYGSKFDLVHCTTLAQALDHLGNTQPDVVVVDLGLPDVLGIEVVNRTQGKAPSVPLVVLTSRADDALGLEALNAGAQDYLVKGELDPRLLSRALRYAMERQRMRLALQGESLLDELTRLYNRRGFLVLAGNHFTVAEGTRKPFALVFIDLDGMKQINDTLGHIEGDRALVEAAGLLSSCVRQSDIVARFGGDEFVLLLESTTENTIRQRLREQLDACNARAGRRYRLSFSVGVVMGGGDKCLTLEELLAEADGLMYRQKAKKKALG